MTSWKAVAALSASTALGILPIATGDVYMAAAMPLPWLAASMIARMTYDRERRRPSQDWVMRPPIPLLGTTVLVAALVLTLMAVGAHPHLAVPALLAWATTVRTFVWDMDRMLAREHDRQVEERWP